MFSFMHVIFGVLQGNCKTHFDVKVISYRDYELKDKINVHLYNDFEDEIELIW